MKSLTRLALAMALLLPAGCERDPAPVEGRWELVTINGDSLPAFFGEIEWVGGTTATPEILSTVLEIGQRTYTQTSQVNLFINDQPVSGNPHTLFEHGEYTFSLNTARFTRATGSVRHWTAFYLSNPERLLVVEGENEAILLRRD